MFFVVRVGRIPGIYTNKEEFLEQVKGFDKPIVKTFQNEKDAEHFFKRDLDDVILEFTNKKAYEKAKKEQKEKEYLEKVSRYTSNGIKLKSENICFLDMEANYGYAISLGAVIYNSNTKEIVDSFYSLMKYSSFKEMDSYAKEVHHIEEKDILEAKLADDVVKEFILFLKKYDVIDIFSWGNSDRSFLKKSLDNKDLINDINITNIQTIISLATKDIKLNKSWALQDMKTFYDIQGEVTHDALNDAKNLALIFKCYQEKKTLNKEAILNC